MSRRAVPVRVLLSVFALAGLVAGPPLDICHHPAGHDGYGHVHGGVAAQSDDDTADIHGPAHRPMDGTSPALGADPASIPIHHDGHLACFTAILPRRPELLLGTTSALDALVSLTGPSLLALGPATPPP